MGENGTARQIWNAGIDADQSWNVIPDGFKISGNFLRKERNSTAHLHLIRRNTFAPVVWQTNALAIAALSQIPRPPPIWWNFFFNVRFLCFRNLTCSDNLCNIHLTSPIPPPPSINTCLSIWHKINDQILTPFFFFNC